MAAVEHAHAEALKLDGGKGLGKIVCHPVHILRGHGTIRLPVCRNTVTGTHGGHAVVVGGLGLQSRMAHLDGGGRPVGGDDVRQLMEQGFIVGVGDDQLPGSAAAALVVGTDLAHGDQTRAAHGIALIPGQVVAKMLHIRAKPGRCHGGDLNAVFQHQGPDPDGAEQIGVIGIHTRSFFLNEFASTGFGFACYQAYVLIQQYCSVPAAKAQAFELVFLLFSSQPGPGQARIPAGFVWQLPVTRAIIGSVLRPWGR